MSDNNKDEVCNVATFDEATPLLAPAAVETENGQPPQIPTVTVIEFEGYTFIKRSQTAEVFLDFQIKAMEPKSQGSVKGVSVGLQAAQEWLIEQMYLYGGQPLTTDIMEESLGWEGWEFTGLANQALTLEDDFVIHDIDDPEQATLAKTRDFSLFHDGRRIRRKKFPVAVAAQLQLNLAKNPIAAVRDLVFKYYTIDEQKITPKMLTELAPAGLGYEVMLVIFQQVQELATKRPRPQISSASADTQAGD